MKFMRLFSTLAVLSAFLLTGYVKTSADSSPLANTGGTVQGLHLVQSDIKNPRQTLWELWAKDAAGQSLTTGFQGDLIGLRARLYEKGIPAATLTAPRAHGDSITPTLTATGGVLVKSLKNAATLQADQVVWQAGINKIIATGHVVYRNRQSGMTIANSVLVMDTVLKTIRTSNPGKIVLPGKLGEKI